MILHVVLQFLENNKKPPDLYCDGYFGYSCITKSNAEVLGLLTGLGSLLDGKLAVLEV